MKINKILVIGGTGMLGFPVTRELIHNGYEVSVLTTDKAAAVVKLGKGYHFIQGDVRSLEQLNGIMAKNQFDGIHINLASMNYKDLQEIEVHGTKNIVTAAKTHNIQKLTMISGMGVQTKNSWSPFIKAKQEMEHIVVNSDIPYTIFNCTHFMESIPKYARNGKISIIGKQPHAVHWIAVSDYANMVCKAFSTKESNNRIISVLGPEALTMKEAFIKYINVVDPTLKYTEAPLSIIRFLAFITFNKTLKYVGDLMHYFEKVPEDPADGTLTDILGRPETTLDQWLNNQ